MRSTVDNDGLLSGIRVLDLADEKASFCSKLLAGMGARVIKIESPGGDASRKIGPFWMNSPHPEKSLSFLYNNTNKLSITVNLEHSDGREIFLRLINRTDVVVETFPPGYLQELRLGFDVLSGINSRLILVSVTGFGQDGPRRDHKSCDLVASAFGGQMYVSGSPSTSPLKAFGEQSHYTASLFATVGILLSLRKRDQSGRGEHIDISLQEAVIATLEHVMIRYFHEQIIPRRQGSLHWNRAFRVFPCQDGFIHMTLFHQWETLVEWMDSECMAQDLTDKKWDDEEYRMRHLDHVIEVLGRWTRTHTRNELFELGQLMGFPWAPVSSPMEIADSPQLKARNFFLDIEHPEVGLSLRYPGLPFKSSRRFSTKQKRAPLVGEDNVHVYQEELGLSEEEMSRLSCINVI
ncbi:MAG: CoA transferase [Desulfobacterales bacterium]|nr:CoA transferase [Desulfobacterales bacterium]